MVYRNLVNDMILYWGLWGLVNHPVFLVGVASLVRDVPNSMLLWLGCRTSDSGCDFLSLGSGWG